MKIAFDVGGVLSKYPDILRPLLDLLCFRGFDPRYGIETHVISDMHPREKIEAMLRLNGIDVRPENIHSADYATHGENCKAVLCEELGIDILIDDFPGYVAQIGSPRLRLLVMPDPSQPYYADEWKTDGSEGAFGRRVRPTKGDHPWP